ncbi:MAG: type II toxin-antitoxin system VapC family toxin [Acidimicrobiales bacterium]
MYLLDTNVISELRKARAGAANHGVAEWAAETPAALLFVSVISLHELEHGVLLAERSDPAKGAILRAWLDNSVIPAFEQRILAVDAAVVRRAAKLHVPDPAPFRDALIAATALVHGFIVATRNQRDFERFDDLTVLNPWT